MASRRTDATRRGSAPPPLGIPLRLHRLSVPGPSRLPIGRALPPSLRPRHGRPRSGPDGGRSEWGQGPVRAGGGHRAQDSGPCRRGGPESVPSWGQLTEWRRRASVDRPPWRCIQAGDEETAVTPRASWVESLGSTSLYLIPSASTSFLTTSHFPDFSRCSIDMHSVETEEGPASPRALHMVRGSCWSDPVLRVRISWFPE